MHSQILSAAKKTRNTAQKKKYFIHLSMISQQLVNEIETKTYRPSQFSCFAVRDPKTREIFAPHFRDRIIHHFFNDKIESVIDKKFIMTSFANRKNKGIHRAIRKIQKILRKKETSYFLKIDIKNFFPSINKKILYEIFQKHFSNLPLSREEKDLHMFLARRIIFHDPTNPSPIFTGNKSLLAQVPSHKSLFNNSKENGLPIGSLSSQFFANIYLNELDQFAKHVLRIKYYFRYVDDIIIIAKDTRILTEYKLQIDDFLRKKLRLSLHPNKTLLQPTKNGIDFLGYIVRKNYILVRRRSVKAFKRRLYFFNHLFNPDQYPVLDVPQTMPLAKKFRREKWRLPIDPDFAILSSILATINSYYGIFCFADSFRLRKNLYEKHFGHLKNFFESKNKLWSVMQIKKEYIPQRTHRT